MSRPPRARRVAAGILGTVQGVGFRPHVFRLARDLALGGFVRNEGGGVHLEVEGGEDAVERFFARLVEEAPRLVAIEGIARSELAPRGERLFAIVESEGPGEPEAPLPPDVATCEACLAELGDPGDRRYRYPFINCTECGPRFSIVRGVPYDRPLTTMAGFALCRACEDEYRDPANRRFHAQPNACPVCGPRLRLAEADGRPASGEDPLEGALATLRGGGILALKGLGGFQLACRADDPASVASLRARKGRPDKPLALMAPDLVSARALVELEPADERRLVGRERPIVLAPRRSAAPLAPAVAPAVADLGVMLPYTPLHHLLLGDLGLPLVMTSGNRAGEPIALRDADALHRLAGIADRFLLHDRPIHARADDSVIRTDGRGGAICIRRARGYAPRSLALPVEAPRAILACGADLKNAFCLASGRRAWLSPHVGDLEDFETQLAFRESLERFARLLSLRPELVVHDLHPDHHGTRFAEETGLERLAVQHHHAHLCACLAEHGETGPAVGALFDGTGYGSDGTIWGGELLIGGLGGAERAGHLFPVRLPGGEQAIRQPWRMACAWLAAAEGAAPGLPPGLAGRVTPERWRAVASLVRGGGPSAPITTSMGRLFDAVAALCGLRAEASYEGQAAMELEAAADPNERGAYPLPVRHVEGGGAPRLCLDARPTIAAAAGDLARGASPRTVSARFHEGVARATARACQALAAERGLGLVVLSGGVFQNRRLLAATRRALAPTGLRVLVPERLPPGDGGIAYGQAAAAAFALARGGQTG